LSPAASKDTATKQLLHNGLYNTVAVVFLDALYLLRTEKGVMYAATDLNISAQLSNPTQQGKQTPVENIMNTTNNPHGEKLSL
jgi:hypothetical protein